MPKNMDSNQTRWGWFGGLLGCGLWMLIAAVLAGLEGSFLSSMYVLGLFAIFISIGFLLWLSPRNLRLRDAVSTLLIASATLSTIAIYVLNSAGVWEAIQLSPWVFSAESSYVILVVVHVVLLLYLRFGPFRTVTD